jgi:hypothetical protein
MKRSRIGTEIGVDQASWGHSRWVSNPASTATKQLTVLREKRILGAGDAAFIPAGVVHATFNGGGEAHLLVIFSPCVGDGFEVVDVSGEAPWNGLRN